MECLLSKVRHGQNKLLNIDKSDYSIIITISIVNRGSGPLAVDALSVH